MEWKQQLSGPGEEADFDLRATTITTVFGELITVFTMVVGGFYYDLLCQALPLRQLW